MFIKTGDMELPDQSKGNVYNNIQPIKDFMTRESPERMQDIPEDVFERPYVGAISGVVVVPPDSPGGVASTILVELRYGATSTAAVLPASAASDASNSASAPAKATSPAEILAASSSSADAGQSAPGDDEN